jgi:hypothetical protein
VDHDKLSDKLKLSIPKTWKTDFASVLQFVYRETLSAGFKKKSTESFVFFLLRFLEEKPYRTTSPVAAGYLCTFFAVLGVAYLHVCVLLGANRWREATLQFPKAVKHFFSTLMMRSSCC